LRPALLIIDMINKFDFPKGADLLKFAEGASDAILDLKRKFNRRGLPVIYVNDNFGHWKEDWKQIQKACSRTKGAALAKKLRPGKGDFFILKPKHSAFYESQLSSLLEQLKVKKLIVTGIAGNICVLFTVSDAHSREFKIIVPQDAIASNTKRENDFTLHQLHEVFKIKTPFAKNIKI
jgi:nicotinamidase-related amidase